MDIRDADIPKYIIMELTEEIPAFELVACGITMPTVDMSACLQQIFDVIALAEDTSFNKMLSDMANYMGKGEGLYENARLDEFEQEQIIKAIIKIGNEIKDRLKFLNAYIDGFFPYSFHRLQGKRIVVLMFSDENYN